MRVYLPVLICVHVCVYTLMCVYVFTCVFARICVECRRAGGQLGSRHDVGSHSPPSAVVGRETALGADT